MDIFMVDKSSQLSINLLFKSTLARLSFIFCLLGISYNAVASGNFYTSGPQATYGAVTYQQANYINVINPAAGAFQRQKMDPEKTIVGSGSFGAGLEYGGVDELFQKIDALSDNFKSSGDSHYEDDEQFSVDPIDDIIDIQDPQFQEIISSVKNRAKVLGSSLILVVAEGYAHTYLDANVNFLINKDIAGGTLSFNFQSSLSSTSIGIADRVDFDEEIALAELKALYNSDLQPGDDIAYYDLSGGLSLSVDPNTGKVRAHFDNDSVIISKAAKMLEFSATYSRALANYKFGTLFVGVKPKLNRIGLTQTAVRLGDLSDSEDLFESSRNLDFNYDSKFGLDLGVYWHAYNYALGSSVVNLTQPTFDYPQIDTSNYSNTAIIKQIKDESHFQLERQLKVEASIFTDDYRWFTGISADVNETQDPLHQHFQWLTWSGGYQPASWWLSSVRTGIKHNLAGSELSYVNIGTTLLKYINLDFSSTLLVTSINDIDLPRGVRADLGFNFAF